MDIINIPANEMKSEFKRILIKKGFTESNADICSGIFMINSLEGIYSHGVNRFPRFVSYIESNYVKPDAEPSLIKSTGAAEQWDGNLGPGPLNALKAVERAMELASVNTIGMVTLRNTNHWMRGGTYGWHAARKGFAFMGWTNTVANMPAWGAKDFRLGNNPFVLAVPYESEAMVLDFAMSQYSYGKLEVYELAGKKLPYPGGFNNENELTVDPSEILRTQRAVPVGYWKGSGLALLLDILAASFSGGLTTSEITKKEAEFSVSQVFIIFDMSKLSENGAFGQVIDKVVNDIKNSEPVIEGDLPRYPGENVIKVRETNLKSGIPVNKTVWNNILSL